MPTGTFRKELANCIQLCVVCHRLHNVGRLEIPKVQFMMEYMTIRGVVRMAAPTVDDAKDNARELIKNGVTARIAVYDLDSPYPYLRVAGWKRPKEPESEQ